MTNVLQHISTAGQRWDQIAQFYYGTQVMVIDGVQRSTAAYLMESNPGVPYFDTFPAGIIIDIPIVEKVKLKIEDELLPPWKRV